jgi:hypothetical protein
MVVESGSYGAFARCQAWFHHIPLGFIKKVRGLGEAVNLNCFSDEIHGLPLWKVYNIIRFIYIQ